MDSTVFMMDKDAVAHGGFGAKAEGHLATGLAREKITGVLPLYLFKEHWEIARRKAGPIFGFMCTLDVMGYSLTQLQVVPFLVLQKAIEENQKNKT